MPARDHFRAHARRRVDLDATLRGRDPAGAQGGVFTHDARVRDLGLGGACIEIADPDAFGGAESQGSITLEVMAPTLWDPLVLDGRVAWIRRIAGRPTRAGVRFEHREPVALYALFQLLGAHLYET
jgi:hypothetical protein